MEFLLLLRMRKLLNVILVVERSFQQKNETMGSRVAGMTRAAIKNLVTRMDKFEQITNIVVNILLSILFGLGIVCGAKFIGWI